LFRRDAIATLLAGSSYSPALMNLGATEWIREHASILRGLKRNAVPKLKI